MAILKKSNILLIIYALVSFGLSIWAGYDVYNVINPQNEWGTEPIPNQTIDIIEPLRPHHPSSNIDHDTKNATPKKVELKDNRLSESEERKLIKEDTDNFLKSIRDTPTILANIYDLTEIGLDKDLIQQKLIKEDTHEFFKSLEGQTSILVDFYDLDFGPDKKVKEAELIKKDTAAFIKSIKGRPIVLSNLFELKFGPDKEILEQKLIKKDTEEFFKKFKADPILLNIYDLAELGIDKKVQEAKLIKEDTDKFFESTDGKTSVLVNLYNNKDLLPDKAFIEQHLIKKDTADFFKKIERQTSVIANLYDLEKMGIVKGKKPMSTEDIEKFIKAFHDTSSILINIHELSDLGIDESVIQQKLVKKDTDEFIKSLDGKTSILVNFYDLDFGPDKALIEQELIKKDTDAFIKNIRDIGTIIGEIYDLKDLGHDKEVKKQEKLVEREGPDLGKGKGVLPEPAIKTVTPRREEIKALGEKAKGSELQTDHLKENEKKLEDDPDLKHPKVEKTQEELNKGQEEHKGKDGYDGNTDTENEFFG